MPKLSPAAVPQLRHHKPSGRAYVRLDGRMLYLGLWGTAESQTAYARAIGEWIARGRKPAVEQSALTVTELIDRYRHWAVGYYVGVDGKPTSESGTIHYALRAWRSLHGDVAVADFGPSHLRTLQEHMVKPVDPSRARIEKEPAPWHPDYGLGWSRTNANAQIRRVVRCLRWAVERELVNGAVYQRCAALSPLRKGRTAARETEPVRPVPVKHVEAVKPFVSRQVAAMIDLQLLTACRAGELVGLRPMDIDTTGEVWIARPPKHKGAHLGRVREIAIGPKAKAILREFMVRPADAPLFSAVEAETDRRAKRHEARQTPLSCGNRPGTNRKDEPAAHPGECYTTHSYRRAIARACKAAGIPQWSPHQLRHLKATLVRREFGLEAAAVYLGHADADTTLIYAEADRDKLIQIAAAVG